MSKVFKTIAVVVLMAMSATTFAQTSDSKPNSGYFEIYAYFPDPIGVQYIPVYAFATITWRDESGNAIAPPVTVSGASIGTDAWNFTFSWNYDADHVTYKVWGTDVGYNTVKQTCGTFVINGGSPLTIDENSWPSCFGATGPIEDKPDNPD